MSKFFWIKERHNPQLGVYFVGLGQISLKSAKSYENPRLYGSNVMHKFLTKEEYEKKLSELKAEGKLLW